MNHNNSIEATDLMQQSASGTDFRDSWRKMGHDQYVSQRPEKLVLEDIILPNISTDIYRSLLRKCYHIRFVSCLRDTNIILSSFFLN